MCIGPQVYPCQSYFEKVGNILKDEWSKIWDHLTCKNIRQREYAPEKCKNCHNFPYAEPMPLELKETKYICAQTP